MIPTHHIDIYHYHIVYTVDGNINNKQIKNMKWVVVNKSVVESMDSANPNRGLDRDKTNRVESIIYK